MSEVKLLNQQIAEAMGLKVEWHYSQADKAGGWVLIEADGTNRGVLCTKPEYAWSAVPDYEHSLSAAWTLFATLPDDCTPRLVRIIAPHNGEIGYTYKAGIIVHDWQNDIEAYDDDPALVVCKAWLAWHTEEAARVPPTAT